MKAKEINPPIFRNAIAKAYYEQMKNKTYVIECGTDNMGDIYFHFANGNTERYSKREFLKLAEQ